MSELYIPPKELSFKLLGYISNHVLYSNTETEPNFGHVEGPTHDDQWWNLIPGTGEHDGCYNIKSKFTGKFLSSRKNMEPQIGHVDGDGNLDDSWFRLEPGTGKLANYFRLRNVCSDQVIVSRTHREPRLGNFSGTATIYEDQYFSFVFEDTEINRIEYKVDEGKILWSIPELIGVSAQSNGTSVPQTLEFNFWQEQTISSTFQYALGFKAPVGSSVKVQIPLVVEGKVYVEPSVSHDFKWESSVSETKTFGTALPATVQPHTEVVAKCNLKRSNITVPFTVYSRSVKTGFEVATEGVYRGVTCWDIQTDVTEKPL